MSPSAQPPLSDAALQRLRDAAELPEADPGHYEIVERIGRGGMGTVYRARDVRLGRDVALKVLHVGPTSTALAERLTREARTLAHLEHPGIVPVHEVGVLPDARPYYTMKLVHGRQLDLAARGRPRAELLRLFTRICEPVAFAHARGVIHRDLKPDNIMVGEFGEVLVLDWGVAKRRDDGHTAERGGTESGTVVGTQGFMAPEQSRGDAAQVDQRADIYALGRILLHLVEVSDAPRFPRPLMAIVRRASHPDPSQRYSDALELAREVIRFLGTEKVEAHRENLCERAQRVYRRHRTLVLLLAAYVVARALIMLWQSGR